MRRSLSNSSFPSMRPRSPLRSTFTRNFSNNGSTTTADDRSTWQTIIYIYWRQYLLLFILLILLWISEGLTPYRHVLYNKTDSELWKYSYPLKTNQVPAWAVPCISVFTPLLAIAAAYFTGHISAFEAHQAGMAAITCVVTTGLATNYIKIHVGRFRPNFVARCWPNGVAPQFGADGRPLCTDDAVDPAEGMKSFPSGHTSWSTSGLGYLSFWLMGKLRCFTGITSKAGPFGLILSLLPLTGAIFIGASRLQDYWHHVEDVAVGFLFGLTMAYCFYRTVYVGVMCSDAGCMASGSSTNSCICSTGVQGGGGMGTGTGGGSMKMLPIVYNGGDIDSKV